MKVSKVFLIIQTVLMYFVHLPFYLVLILVKVPDFSNEGLLGGLMLAGIIMFVVALPFLLVSLIVAIVNGFKEVSSPTKTTLTCKLVLIPWYLLNLLVCILLIAGFLNPFLLLAVPVILGIEISITYCFMVTSSAHNISYITRYYIKSQTKPSTKMIVAIIFHFIFFLDVIGAIMLHNEMKKLENN